MSLLWADFPSGSQGLYGNQPARMLNGTPWIIVAGSDLIDDPDPTAAGGRCFRVEATVDNSQFDGCPTIAFPSSSAGAGVSCRVWYTNFEIPTNSSGRGFPIALRSASNTNGYAVRQEVSGALSIVRINTASSITTLETTAGPVITPNAWWHLSFKADATTGECSLQVNGVEVLTATDPSPVAAGTLGMFKSVDREYAEASGNRLRLKDLMIWNTEGTQNNDHPGNVTVFYRPVSGDITLGGWVPSTGGTGTSILGNEGPPDDGIYLSADDTPPAFMEYDLTDLPEDVTSVRGVISVVRAAKIDGGDGNLQVSLSPDGVTYADGADRPITTAFTYWSDVNELNPDTGNPYLPVEFNGTRIKINRTL